MNTHGHARAHKQHTYAHVHTHKRTSTCTRAYALHILRPSSLSFFIHLFDFCVFIYSQAYAHVQASIEPLLFFFFYSLVVCLFDFCARIYSHPSGIYSHPSVNRASCVHLFTYLLFVFIFVCAEFLNRTAQALKDQWQSFHVTARMYLIKVDVRMQTSKATGDAAV